MNDDVETLALLAKDLGVVLAELWGDRTHTDAAVDLDQGADVRDVAQFAVGGVLGAMASSARRTPQPYRGYRTSARVSLGPNGLGMAPILSSPPANGDVS